MRLCEKENGQWAKVGQMSRQRRAHASSVMQLKDIKPYCAPRWFQSKQELLLFTVFAHSQTDKVLNPRSCKRSETLINPIWDGVENIR